MKCDILLDAIGAIDDELIIDAKNGSIKKRFGVKKTVSLILAAVLCIAFASVTFARPIIRDFYKSLECLITTLKPVNESCIDNGIKMEVISAKVEENKAYVYVSMQDIESDRIDETTDLYDSYFISGSFDSFGSCDKIGYDEETKMATFLITIGRTDGKNLSEGKVNFSVRKFLSRKSEIKGIIDEIDLSLVDTNPEMQSGVKIRGYGGGSEIKDVDVDSLEYLVPQGEYYSPAPDVTITAIGYKDGILRIQTFYKYIFENDNHGFFHLVDENGNKIHSYMNVSYWDEGKNGRYEEVFFKISEEDFKSCELYGEFYISGLMTNGHWEVTFNIEDLG